MISKKDLQQIINSNKNLKSIPRKKYLKEITPWLSKKEIIIIKGIRRCGKTHIMHQLIQTLPNENVFYINFDDFRLDQHLTIELLELIMGLRNSEKRVYFFLDEIQRVKGFEKWLRTYYDREENIKFVIGGSNISLLSPKLSTVLTGRNITFEINPLDYKEFKTFSKEPIETFFEFGGFPEVVLAQDETTKRKRLEQYKDDIIAKDIIEKYELSNVTQLKAIVQFFLNNPGIKISANKLGKQLGIHKDTAQKYIEYIKDTFLIFEVPYFSYSAKTKYIGAQAPKYYCADNGLHTITTTRKNNGTLLENAVAIKLKEQNKELFYWQDNIEIDFVADQKAIQVTASKDIPQREIESFEKFKKKHKRITKHVIISEEKKGKENNIIYVPIKEFFEK